MPADRLMPIVPVWPTSRRVVYESPVWSRILADCDFTVALVVVVFTPPASSPVLRTVSIAEYMAPELISAPLFSVTAVVVVGLFRMNAALALFVIFQFDCVSVLDGKIGRF